MDKSTNEEKKVEKLGHIIDHGRVFNFSDGVFAFAATLLVVKIDLPDTLRQQFTSQFANAFAALLPQYIVCIVTFLVIGYYWLNHHAIFSHIKRFNSTIVWLNILFLISIAFLPFPVDLYGDFPMNPAIVVFYSASLALSGYLLLLIWWYASSHHHLVDLELPDKTVHYYLMRNLMAPLVFTLSIPLVYIHPLLTPFSWIFVLIGIFIVNGIFKIHTTNEVGKATL